MAAPTHAPTSPDHAPHPGHEHEHRAPSRVPRWLAPAAVGVGVAAASLYTAWQDPNSSSGIFPQCPLREVTGLDCPGCGGLRATHSILHGDVLGAFDHNVVVTLLLPVLFLLWLRWMITSLGYTVPKVPTIPKPAWIAFGVAVVGFAVVRNIEGVALFEYLHSTT